MTTFRRRIVLQAAKIFDLALMALSFGLATVLVARENPATSLAEFLSMRIKLVNFALFALFLLAWRLVFSSFGLYSSKRLSPRGAEMKVIVKAATLGSAMVWAAAIVLRVGMVTPLFILLFWAASTLAGVGSRAALRYMLGGIRKRGRNLRELVVVGTNPRAVRFARKMEARPDLGFRIAGFVDGPWAGM